MWKFISSLNKFRKATKKKRSDNDNKANMKEPLKYKFYKRYRYNGDIAFFLSIPFSK